MIEAILAPENLYRAWEQVQENKGRPGIDGVSLARWARNWQANVERLREQVRSNTYRPNRPKRFLVYKNGGGYRELSRLTVTDKVMQRAVLNIIEETFEKRFLGCSHGYRSRRSVATAVEDVLNYRDQGFVWLLDADIRSCFDNFDHNILQDQIHQAIDDWFVLNLIDLWLKAGRRHSNKAIGVPMGGVLSPLWCNIYLNQLDQFMYNRGWKITRYADDFIIQAKTQTEAELSRELTEQVLKTLKLELSPQKTNICTFAEGFVFLGVTFHGNTYSYEYLNKRVQIKGKKLTYLYQHLPDFYS